jgi:hypothetical protein
MTAPNEGHNVRLSLCPSSIICRRITVMELACVSVGYGEGWLASRSGLSVLTSSFQSIRIMKISKTNRIFVSDWEKLVPAFSDVYSISCTFCCLSDSRPSVHNSMTRHGMTMWQGIHSVLSPHMVWHDDQGATLCCPFTCYGTITRGNSCCPVTY